MESSALVKFLGWLVAFFLIYTFLMPSEDTVIESRTDYVGTTTTMKDGWGNTTTCRLVTIGDTSKMTCN